MSDVPAAITPVKEILLVPGRCSISKNHKRVNLHGNGSIDDLPESLVLGCGCTKEFYVVMHRVNETFCLLPSASFTVRLQSEDNIEEIWQITQAKRSIRVKNLQLSEHPLTLTVEMNENPDISASVIITAEAPRRLLLFDTGIIGHGFCIDRRQHLLKSLSLVNSPTVTYTPEEFADLQMPDEISLGLGESHTFSVLAEYSGERWRWASNRELQVEALPPQGADVLKVPEDQTYEYFRIKVISANEPEFAVAVKSRFDENIRCAFTVKVIDAGDYEQTCGLSGSRLAAMRRLQAWVDDAAQPMPIKYIKDGAEQFDKPVPLNGCFYGFSFAVLAESADFVRVAEKLAARLREYETHAGEGEYLWKVRSAFAKLLDLRKSMLRHYLFESERKYHGNSINIRRIIDAYNKVILGLLEDPAVSLHPLKKVRRLLIG